MMTAGPFEILYSLLAVAVLWHLMRSLHRGLCSTLGLDVKAAPIEPEPGWAVVEARLTPQGIARRVLETTNGAGAAERIAGDYRAVGEPLVDYYVVPDTPALARQLALPAVMGRK